MDILQAFENQGVMCLVLLDLSAAFDMVDHQILLSKLRQKFAVRGKVLGWFELYPTKHT